MRRKVEADARGRGRGRTLSQAGRQGRTAKAAKGPSREIELLDGMDGNATVAEAIG